MGKVIAIANQKGGVGKTTTAAVLADLLNQADKKVLLIDMDGQANLTYNMGISRPDKLEKTMKDALMDKVNDIPIDWSVEIVLRPGLSIFPASIELSGVEMSLINAFQREQILRMVLKEICNNYDYIIIDTSPSLGLLTINSLVAADEVVIPVQAQIFAIKGMEQLFRSIALAQRVNENLSIAGFLITMVDGRSDSQKDTISQLEGAFGDYVQNFETVIPLQINASDAAKEQKSITEFDPNGAAAKAYKNWLTEYLGHTSYRDAGCNIEVGDILHLNDNDYLVCFGTYKRQTRDGKMVSTLGPYMQKINAEDPGQYHLSLGAFMQKYRRQDNGWKKN